MKKIDNVKLPRKRKSKVATSTDILWEEIKKQGRREWKLSDLDTSKIPNIETWKSKMTREFINSLMVGGWIKCENNYSLILERKYKNSPYALKKEKKPRIMKQDEVGRIVETPAGDFLAVPRTTRGSIYEGRVREYLKDKPKGHVFKINDIVEFKTNKKNTSKDPKLYNGLYNSLNRMIKKGILGKVGDYAYADREFRKEY